ncbi:hypothetical protein HG536_0E03780 [Torulaspora globosa]|uniref:Uncharacterized protein n=1 Tax=Torulaspora globosa TaxID=48254 RepID=A0A7G3ZIY1_9SACH|nr:uncharacterized protein HG536_0E03780 [Torulaspora globosa]QLL33467.1 hypothetical protein HG536_0E03780 [Torulaspora globosa]
MKSMQDPQKLLKEHQVGSLDVDWLIGARNLDTNQPAVVEGSLSRPLRSRSGSIESGDPLSDIPIAKIVKGDQVDNRKTHRNSSAVTELSAASGINAATGSSELRRTKSLSSATGSNYASGPRPRGASISESEFRQQSHNGERRMGFFKSLFSRKNKSKNESLPVTGNNNTKLSNRPFSRRSSTVEVVDSRLPFLKEDEDGDQGAPLARSKTASTVLDEHSSHYHRHDSQSGCACRDDVTSAKMNAEGNDGRDPRLMEFLEYYKSKGYSVAAFNERSSISRNNQNGFLSRSKTASFSIDDNLAEIKEEKPKAKKYDAKGRPIPPHPKRSKLPPALKTTREKPRSNSGSDSDSDSASSSTTTPSSSHKFGAFLKKVTSYGGTNVSSADTTREELSSERRESTAEKKTGFFDPGRAEVVPGLECMKALKHVSFATSTYFNDPPQQICSKHPRQGEVEVKPDGSVVIHRLTPEERRKVMENASSGVVVGGTGQLRLLVEQDDDVRQSNDVRKQEQMAPRASSPSSSEPDREMQGRKDEPLATETVASSQVGELRRTSTNNEEEVKVSNIASRVKIDKPMVSRRATGTNSQTSLSSMISQESVVSEETLPPRDAKLPHDVVYTRCCHLREILPIPATMKQLKKGSTDPIPLLQLRNPRPSMVEIWSFSDFLSIAPVLCLSLDGVTLSVDMFRVILSALVNKKGFEKLSLRNTSLDHEGWKILCYYVSKATSLTALDLTMVPIIKTNVQKPSKSSLKNNIIRMECDLQSRKEMNWNLLAASIAKRGGLEEIIISGAQMPQDQFENFIEVACIATQRLGLAYNCLTKEQCDMLAKWILQSNVTGLDVGFNDLKGKLSAFSNAVLDKIRNKGEKNVLKYISLNCTGLEVGSGNTSDNNEVLRLLSVLCYCENLKFLDLSNNPKMFPNCLSTLVKCLPVFVNLVRLHLDYEGLESTAVVMLAEMFPLCTRLNYLSMLGTKFDLASCKALAEAVRKSSSLITLDIDYACMPPSIKEKLSLYTMRNVESELNKVKTNNGKPSNPKCLDVGDNLSNLQEELSILLTDSFKDGKSYDKLVEGYIEKVTAARKKIKKVVKDLFDIRVKGQLSTEGKETLIRLCFIDASFEKGIKLLQERHLASGVRKDDKEFANKSAHILPDMCEADQFIKSRYLEPSDASLVPTSTVLYSSAFNQSGHSALLPFGRPDVEDFNPRADDTVELRDEDEGSSRKVSYQTQEEGKVFRKSDLMMKNVERFASEDGLPIDKDLLGRAAESLDSDQIKDLLLKTNVSTVVDVIDELHNQGYHLHDIFKKHDGAHDGAHEKLVALSPQPSPADGTGATDRQSSGAHQDLIESPEPETHKDEKEAIDAAYDQVLDSIQKERKSE